MITLLLFLWITLGSIAMYLSVISKYTQLTMQRIVYHLLFGPIALIIVLRHDRKQVKIEELYVHKRRAIRLKKSDYHTFVCVTLIALVLSACGDDHYKTVAVRDPLHILSNKDMFVHETHQVGDTVRTMYGPWIIIKDYSKNNK